MLFRSCSACQTLETKRPGSSGYHNIDEVLAWINVNKAPSDEQYTHDDLSKILDTEGDRQNGGGFFLTDKSPQGRMTVKWQSESNGPIREGIGQIGSPAMAPMHMPWGRTGF